MHVSKFRQRTFTKLLPHVDRGANEMWALKTAMSD